MTTHRITPHEHIERFSLIVCPSREHRGGGGDDGAVIRVRRRILAALLHSRKEGSQKTTSTTSTSQNAHTTGELWIFVLIARTNTDEDYATFNQHWLEIIHSGECSSSDSFSSSPHVCGSLWVLPDERLLCRLAVSATTHRTTPKIAELKIVIRILCVLPFTCLVRRAMRSMYLWLWNDREFTEGNDPHFLGLATQCPTRLSLVLFFYSPSSSSCPFR